MRRNENLLENILQTACVLLQKRGEPALARVLAETNLKFIEYRSYDGDFGTCGLTVNLTLDSMHAFELLPENSQQLIVTCLRKVAFGHVGDRNGNESPEEDIEIDFRLQLIESTEGWRGSLRLSAPVQGLSPAVALLPDASCEGDGQR